MKRIRSLVAPALFALCAVLLWDKFYGNSNADRNKPAEPAQSSQARAPLIASKATPSDLPPQADLGERQLLATAGSVPQPAPALRKDSQAASVGVAPQPNSVQLRDLPPRVVIASSMLVCPIEVGSVGVKARAIDLSFDAQCNLSTKTLYSEDENTDIFKTIQQGRLMPDAIQATAKAVGKLAGQMQAKYPACPTLVVGSSGVALASNTAELKQAVAAEGFKDMGFVTPEQEAKYAFRSSIPDHQRAAAVLVDIGGANTKIGYVKEGEFQSMNVGYGSTSLAKAATDSGLPFRSGVAKTLMDQVLPKFRDDAKAHPDMLKRTSVFWVGGMAWATAAFSHPEFADKSSVTISRSDLEEFLVALEKDTWKSRQAPSGMTPAAQAAWNKDWADVQKIFTRERLIAGVTLMKVMLSDGLYRESVTFPRYGQWVWGYSLEWFNMVGTSCR